MAFPIRFGGEFLVNTTTVDDQEHPAITGLADGRFVMTWTDWSRKGADSSKAGVYAQLFNADGSKAGSEFLVNTVTKYSQYRPAVTALADGGFAVAWIGHSQTGAEYSGPDIHMQIFNGDGSKVGAEILVNTRTYSYQSGPVITEWADGRLLVAWADKIGGGRLRAQVFDTDGSRVGAEFLVDSDVGYSASSARIAMLADGRFMAVWRAHGVSGKEIHARLFNADGSRVGDEFRIVPAVDSDQGFPEITPLADGRFVVSWSEGVGDLRDPDKLRAQVFNADGSQAGTDFVISSTTTQLRRHAVTAFADGRFVVVWQELTDGELHAQVFNGDGTKVGAEFVVNTTRDLYQFDPTITTLADGRFVVGWTDFSGGPADPSGRDIYGQIFDPRDSAITLNGSVLAEDFVGTRFGDVIRGRRGDDVIVGGGGDDILSGGAGRDLLKGSRGDDRLIGKGGGDVLRGGSGGDVLKGGAGRDKLIGGAGRDVMTGGAGADTFDFNSPTETGDTAATRDRITDFSQTDGDVIDLSGIDADSGAAGNQAFAFIGTAAFSGTAGELRYVQNGANTIVQADLDGDGAADLQIRLDGLIALTAGDFVL